MQQAIGKFAPAQLRAEDIKLFILAISVFSCLMPCLMGRDLPETQIGRQARYIGFGRKIAPINIIIQPCSIPGICKGIQPVFAAFGTDIPFLGDGIFPCAAA